MSLKFNFEGKVVLITGSSAGIGATTAQLFSKSGANVVVTGRNTDNVKEVAKQCRDISQNKTKVLEVIADITNEEDVKRLVNETIKIFGKLDILVNNAGGNIAPISITDSDCIQKFNKIMALNLNSVVLLTHLSVPHLEKTKGNIINISSIAGMRSGTVIWPYRVAKCALDMFTPCMAAELGAKGIRVNGVNPGLIKTEFQTKEFGLDHTALEALRKRIGQSLPTGRIGEPEDIANAILFLASDVSSFMTGSQLLSDGGHLAANVN